MDTKDEQESLSAILQQVFPSGAKASEFDRQRQEANLELAAILVQLLTKHGSQRFSQVLRNYGFVRETRPVKPDAHWVDWKNEFNLEPQELLKRVKKRVENIDGQSSDTETSSGTDTDDNT